MRCPSCGFDNPAEMRFCGHCGAALTSATQAAEERKVVTLLFADVVGSTRLSGVLDAEELRERMGRFFGIAREETERFGGTVEKFIGDAVMAVFGLPTIHEDDPERAVHAAVAMRKHIRPFIEAGIIPQIRIGINTGAVVANPRAAEKGEFMVTGEPVNVAARLQQLAEPGQILVGQPTYEATRWAFDYQVVEPLEVKGIDGGIPAFVCMGLRAQPLTPRGVAGVSSPLVGRQAEVAALLAILTRLRGGEGGIVAVIGEPGIGKSRLMADVKREVGDEVRWLVGRTLSFSQSISYWPFLEIIKSAVGVTEADGPAESRTKLERRVGSLLPEQLPEVAPYLEMLLGLEVKEEWRDRVQYLDGEAMGRQIYRSCRLFFERLARERPLVLMFEDLHWIDTSSGGLLEHLLPLTSTEPLLICGVSRPDRETPAASLRETLLRTYGDRYTEMTLIPLSPQESAMLVRNLLRIDDLPARLHQVILEKTEGNPFFMEEVIRSLIDLGAIAKDEAAGRWRVSAQIDTISIPDTLRGVIVARIDRLDEDVKQVLKTASVIGRSFFYRVLRAIAEVSADLDRHLADLQRLELVHERRRAPELEFAFKHALTQEAAYETILLRVRRELHRRVAQAIRELFAGRLEEFYGLLAFHYARAEEWEKAQDYLFRAGDQAVRLAADAEALDYYRQATAAYARAFGDRWDPLHRAVLERKMGEALYRRGDHQQALEYLHRALGLLGSSLPASPGGVRLAIFSQIMRQVGHRLLAPLFLRHPADRPHPPVAEERERIYQALAWIDYFVRVDNVILDSLLMLNVSEQYHFRPGVARGSSVIGLMCNLIPAPRIAAFYHRRAVEMAEQIQHSLAIGLAHFGLGLHQYHTGDAWDEAFEHFKRSAGVYRQAGELRQWGAATGMMAVMSRARGDLAYCRELEEEMLRIGQETSDVQLQAWGEAELGNTLGVVGDVEHAVPHLQRGLELFRAIPDYVWVAFSLAGLGLCYLRLGRVRDAVETLEESNHLIARHGFRGFLGLLPRGGLMDAYLTLAEQSAGQEREAWLRKAGRVGRTFFKQCRVDRYAVMAAYRLQGRLDWLTGRPRAAQRWWRRSLEVAAHLGAQYEQGLTYLEIGRRTGDRTVLEQAERLFSAIGAHYDRGRAAESLQKAG